MGWRRFEPLSSRLRKRPLRSFFTHVGRTRGDPWTLCTRHSAVLWEDRPLSPPSLVRRFAGSESLRRRVVDRRNDRRKKEKRCIPASTICNIPPSPSLCDVADGDHLFFCRVLEICHRRDHVGHRRYDERHPVCPMVSLGLDAIVQDRSVSAIMQIGRCWRDVVRACVHFFSFLSTSAKICRRWRTPLSSFSLSLRPHQFLEPCTLLCCFY